MQPILLPRIDGSGRLRRVAGHVARRDRPSILRRTWRATRVVVAALVVSAVILTACASRAWRIEPGGSDASCVAPHVPAHRAVERVTLRAGGRTAEFVGYRTCDPARLAARTQWLLDSGISVLDVAVRGGAADAVSAGAFEAVPGAAAIALEDLRRVWGSRSVFGRVGANGPAPHAPPFRALDGAASHAADALADGSYLAFTPAASDAAEGRVRVTLLDADLVPEARIEYGDFDADGMPGEIRLIDLRDGHTLDVEVEQRDVTRTVPE